MISCELLEVACWGLKMRDQGVMMDVILHDCMSTVGNESKRKFVENKSRKKLRIPRRLESSSRGNIRPRSARGT